jgi:hypothetical protein
MAMSESEEALTTYCGLYCGDCHNYNGEIADLARDLRKKLREADFARISVGMSRYFKEFGDYEQCYNVLGAMVRLRCKKGCRNGGGPPQCKIRNCCVKKGIEGCWDCGDFETCAKLDFLRPVHADAHVKNLKLIRKNGVASFVKGKRHW